MPRVSPPYHASCLARGVADWLWSPWLPPQNSLLPGFHKAYWLGTQATDPKSFTSWIDTTVRPPLSRGYKHWGMDGGSLEPNNRQGLELCAVANASQTFSKAWGWSDTLCDSRFPTMCRMISEWRALEHAWPSDCLQCMPSMWDILG